jgi:hypothetical protein
VGCGPLNGWARKDAVLAGTHSLHQPAVHVTGLGGQFAEVLQAAQDADVVGIIDDGLDPQRPAELKVPGRMAGAQPIKRGPDIPRRELP